MTASVLCCCGPTHFLFGCNFGFEWKLRVQQTLLPDVTAAICICLIRMSYLSHDWFNSFCIYHPLQTSMIRWKSAGLPLIFCSHSVLTGVCIAGPGLYYCLCATCLWWIINEGDASPKLIRRRKQRPKNRHRHRWACVSTLSRFRCKCMDCFSIILMYVSTALK